MSNRPETRAPLVKATAYGTDAGQEELETFAHMHEGKWVPMLPTIGEVVSYRCPDCDYELTKTAH